MRRLVLFDIDGTLVLTGGAGTRALNRAFAKVFHIDDAVDGVTLAGRTDLAIIGDVLAKTGVDATANAAGLDALRDCYFAYLHEEMQSDGPGKRVLPGVRALLDALSQKEHVGMGLLTGNLREGARIKLEHFELWRFFGWGAFGELLDRNALLPVALDRARAAGFSTTDPRSVFVIGDTPQDVSCARSGGATAIGVATGPYPPEVLRDSGADAVFDDLTDTDRLVALIDAPR